MSQCACSVGHVGSSAYARPNYAYIQHLIPLNEASHESAGKICTQKMWALAGPIHVQTNTIQGRESDVGMPTHDSVLLIILVVT